MKFFLRSGLSQECLGQVRALHIALNSSSDPTSHHVQIWELSSGGAAKLTNPQFGAALNLVSLAQVQQDI